MGWRRVEDGGGELNVLISCRRGNLTVLIIRRRGNLTELQVPKHANTVERAARRYFSRTVTGVEWLEGFKQRR